MSKSPYQTEIDYWQIAQHRRNADRDRLAAASWFGRAVKNLLRKK